HHPSIDARVSADCHLEESRRAMLEPSDAPTKFLVVDEQAHPLMTRQTNQLRLRRNAERRPAVKCKAATGRDRVLMRPRLIRRRNPLGARWSAQRTSI